MSKCNMLGRLLLLVLFTIGTSSSNGPQAPPSPPLSAEVVTSLIHAGDVPAEVPGLGLGLRLGFRVKVGVRANSVVHLPPLPTSSHKHARAHTHTHTPTPTNTRTQQRLLELCSWHWLNPQGCALFAQVASAKMGPRVNLFLPAPFSLSFDALFEPVYLPVTTNPISYQEPL